MEDVVHALLDYWRVKVVLFGDHASLLELLRATFARAPVECHTLVNDPGERANSLEHRYGSIRAVCEDDVEVVCPETGKRVANALNDAEEL